MARKFDPAHAHKLDGEERQAFQPADEILNLLSLKPAMTIADLGCGTGYFALPLAKAVGDQGKVYGLDVSEKLLAMLQEKVALHGLSNIELVEAEAEKTGLSEHSVDMVFMANVWHEFEDHAKLLAECGRILKTGGQVVIVDWRPGVERPPGPPEEERISKEQAASELEGSGFALTKSVDAGKYHYLVLAQKR